MNPNKMDRRVRYTKSALRESLLDLLREKPIGRVTVADLCRRADINRNTFYAHYQSPGQLLLEIEDELFEEISRSLRESNLSVGSINGLLEEILQLIAQNSDLCAILFGEFGDKDYIRKIMYIAHDESMRQWGTVTSLSQTQLERIYTFVVNGSVAVISEWLAGGAKESTREIADFINAMSAKGLGAYFKV